MPPKPKGRAKKGKGDSASAPLTKQTKKAAKHCQISATLVPALGLTEGDEVGWATEDKGPASIQEVMAQKLAPMMEICWQNSPTEWRPLRASRGTELLQP